MKQSSLHKVEGVAKRQWVTPELSRMRVEETLSSPPYSQGESNAHSNGLNNGNVPGGDSYS
ncbi:hypothetical protein [Halomonas sp. NO4]|uniref:hypothetical protein n=1 Tax=Halomonas sp. NO4 TaxID=2484813 RepID=UPI0013D52332|nr:hypothetical protein [Halomonas sp. NO4]